MSIRTSIISRAAALLTSDGLERRRRTKAERNRIKRGEEHGVDLFIDVADPYSLLLTQCLVQLCDRYDVKIRPWLVPGPDDAAAPERAMLADWSVRDCRLLADRHGLAFPLQTRPPGADAQKATAQRIAGAIAHGQSDPAHYASLLAAHWAGSALPPGPDGDADSARAAGEAARSAAGHYLGGTLAYGGECYWGVDRLHYLEARLRELGLCRDSGQSLIAPPPPDIAGQVVEAPAGRAIDFFLSFRSPYTWIATERIAALAAAHGAALNLRFVLPMVMRSLPVPPAKRRYITIDAARESRRLAIPFGRIADPVGRPVERAYSLLPWAREQGRGIEFCTAFMRGVWAQGIDAGSDAGLARIVEGAGLDWKAASNIVGNDDWRDEAETNRAAMIAHGLWGVPSFAVGDTAVWGQDRLWVIDAALRRG